MQAPQERILEVEKANKPKPSRLSKIKQFFDGFFLFNYVTIPVSLLLMNKDERIFRVCYVFGFRILIMEITENESGKL